MVKQMVNRRRFLRNATLSTGALALSPLQQLFAAAVFPSAGNFTEIRNGVGYYTERGGTIGWLLSSEASVVVDTQFKDQAQNLLSGLRERRDFQRLDLLINTHHHGDHTGGNPVFEGIFAEHVAHENARINQKSRAEQEGKLNEVLLPGTTYTESWNKKVGGETVALNYFGPGHTNGDSVIHFQNANVAHIGDLLFNRRFPYIDPEAGGTFTNWAKVLKAIRKFYEKDTIYIFGHAAEGYEVTGSQEDLKAMENYIKRLLKYVKKEKRKGTSLEQLIAKTELIPGAEEWKHGERLRQRNLEVAWEEI